MLSQQAWVLSPMEPSMRLALASAGIWPETKIWPLALMAWDCLYGEIWLVGFVFCEGLGFAWMVLNGFAPWALDERGRTYVGARSYGAK